MPSAASSSQSRSRGGLARPDTAPSSTKRSVRFSDDLGLGDELFGSERPSTAPGKRQAKRGDKDENVNGSYLDDNKKPLEGNKPIRRETTSSGRDRISLATKTQVLCLQLKNIWLKFDCKSKV